MTITRRELVTRLYEESGLGGRSALRAIRATLFALGEGLPEPERSILAKALPRPWARILVAPEAPARFDALELYDRVRIKERTSVGFAREHAQVVCNALGELLPADTVLRATHVLHDSVAELFQGRPALGAPEIVHRVSGERHHTIASGRAGSRHPVSEGRPPGPHAHSVGEADPYKLSTATGMTQEEDESLATARPDPHRTIAESKD